MQARPALPLLGALVLTACSVDEDGFYARLFPCDTSAKEDTCGTTRAGAPMTCFAAGQLGARAVCVEACEQPGLVDEGAALCLESKAKMTTCRPSLDGGGPAARACENPALSCLRTDALGDEGVCVTVGRCDTDDDCRDPVRSICAATPLRERYAPGAGLRADHLHCLKGGCLARQSMCQAGENCLPKVMSGSSHPPDICVPDCDAQLDCPPNYVCYRKVSGDAAPRVCVPGFLGFRCSGNADCMLGECVDSGEGFRLCSAACATTSDCEKLGQGGGDFVCTDDFDGEGRHCLDPATLGGSPCRSDTDCRPVEVCVRFDQTGSATTIGECRQRCDDRARCSPRVGITHSCVDGGAARACFPGRFFVACTDEADCIPDLQCNPVSFVDAEDQPISRRLCTLSCSTDEDCRRLSLAGSATFCETGQCAPLRQNGRVCQTDHQCASGHCILSSRVKEPVRNTKRCE